MQLEECRKTDLCELAAHYGLSVSRADLKAVVVEILVEKGFFKEDLPRPGGGIERSEVSLASALAEGTVVQLAVVHLGQDWW